MNKISGTLTLKLLNLHCYFVEERDYDDVYLKYDGARIWPMDKKHHPMSMDTTKTLDIEIPGIAEDSEIVIELWDWDLLSPDDKYGTFTLTIGRDAGILSTDMIQNTKETKKAKYTLDWQVI